MYIEERNKFDELLDTIYEAVTYCDINVTDIYIPDCLEALSSIQEIVKDRISKEFIEEVDCVKKLLEESRMLEEVEAFKQKLAIVKDKIINIKQILRDNKHIKVRILFLPYKASMWTSFDSIWRAAQANPQCECTVMPIPYYEIYKYSQVQNYCYEGEQLPKEVTITDFREVNIYEQKYDIIFIHNPYDDTNTLTMIDPRYFSRNLKLLTDLLVYSPYYTIRYFDGKNRIKLCDVEAMKHVDKVLIQSKRLEEIYQFHGYAKEKLLALGSPKIDAVVNRIKQPPEIPNEWREKVKGKKVFLLNTHLSFVPRLKQLGIDVIKKMIEAVICRETCALIWRPHPLSINMIEKEVPEYLEAYYELIEYVNNAENGIIDTYSDYAYAFSVSDAMLSTRSSLITEYMITGKPVFMWAVQDSEKVNKISPVDYSFNYYRKRDEFEPDDFVEMVERNEDPYKKQRVEMIQEAFINSKDASCGKKTLEILIKEVLVRGGQGE